MKIKALNRPLIIILFCLFLLTACASEELAHGRSIYWQTPGYFKEEVYIDDRIMNYIYVPRQPVFWFYSDVSDGKFENTIAAGELLVNCDKDTEEWIPINIKWDVLCFMTITGPEGDVLFRGRSDVDTKTMVLTFYIDENNIYPDLRESFVMHAVPSDSADGPVFTKVRVQ